MQTATRLKQGFDRYVVYVPRKEWSRFQDVVTPLGVEIEAKNALDEALEDIMAGRVYEADSVNELRKRFA